MSRLEKIYENIPTQEGALTVAIDVETVAEIGALQHLPAILDLKAAAPLAAALLARRGADITIGAGDVQRLGGQCLQVLLSAKASWREDRNLMCFEAPSPEFLAALELFGIASDLLFHQEESVA